MNTLPDRIENKIMPEPNTGCWIWIGAIGKHGYGNVREGYSHKRAHRLVYEIFKGPIPFGLVLDHRCKVTCCVNPDHLEVTTQKINVQRGNRWK